MLVDLPFSLTVQLETVKCHKRGTRSCARLLAEFAVVTTLIFYIGIPLCAKRVRHTTVHTIHPSKLQAGGTALRRGRDQSTYWLAGWAAVPMNGII